MRSYHRVLTLKSMIKLIKNEQGSFTIEASLVMPIVMLSTIILLFLGLYVYQKVYVQQLARTVAEQTANNWDNSHKDPTTGNFNPGEYDGLYWRLTGDSVSDLFGFIVSNAPTTVQIPSLPSGSQNLAEKKLAVGASVLPKGLTGTAVYTNHLVDRKVTVNLNKPFHMPKLIFDWGGSDTVHADANSHVVEPVELIRLTDITRTYISSIKGRISPQAAKKALVEPDSGSFGGEAITISSERQAASYLVSLVGGSEKVLTTPLGSSRTVDALDPNGVAHIAFYTYTEGQLRAEQMPKDIELLKQGTQVKGVVWHFFKKDANGAVGPSDKLRRELESKGIVVVIHN
jgi:hypothetical protein